MFHNPYSNAFNLGIIGRHLLQHWKSIYRPGTNFPLISAASIFSRWWRSWIWWWQKDQSSNNVYLPAPNKPFQKKIKAVSQYFDVDQDTERKLKRCERSQDPDLKQSFCSLLVNMYSSHSFAGGNSAILRHLCKISAANVTKNFALSAFTTWSVFFPFAKKFRGWRAFIGYVSE